jgi:hypothetical protein
VFNGEETVSEEVKTLHDELTTSIPDIEVGVSLKNSEFLKNA